MLALVYAIPARAQSAVGEVDIFAGVDFKYHDIFYSSLFETLIRLTPGARWRFAPGWDIATQVYVPIVNQYGERFSNVQLNIASVSKQMRLGDHFALKASAGQFSHERYGLDLKALYMATSWLAAEAQLGLTGYSEISSGAFKASPMKRLSGQLGIVGYIPRAVLEMRLRGGRYAYGDWGGEAEFIRHFSYTSISANARYSNVTGPSAGFHITVMLPPYTRRRHTVNFRPASNFELNYTNRSDYDNNVRYLTDPEENMRTGWFDPQVAPWGFNATNSDYRYLRSNQTDSIKP